MKYLKDISMTPKYVLAGDSVEFSIKIILGSDFWAENSRIILDMPAYLGYTRPSCYGQEVHGFMEVFCSNPDIKYKKRVWNLEQNEFNEASARNYFDKMAIRLFVLDFLGGVAEENDEIIIKWGYTRDNFGVGTKITTLVLQKEFINTINMRYFVDGTYGLPDYGRNFKGFNRPVPDAEIPLRFKILPREVESLRIIKKIGKALILPMDRYGNVGELTSQSDLFKDISVKQNDYGVYETVDEDIKLASSAYPVLIAPDMRNVFQGMNIYFGDMHTHSSISNDCIEREKQEIGPDGQFSYARDVAGLDFMALTDHHQPWDIERNKIGKSNWEKIQSAAQKFNAPGTFVAYPGFEFRCERGDTQVILNEHFDYEIINNPRMKNIKDLWEHFKGRDYISIFHFHNPGRLKIGEWYSCPYEGIEPVIEVYSCHGSYEREDVQEMSPPEVYNAGIRPDRNGNYFIQNGHRHGYICSSDGHKGNPGRNGLTAVYARELTRESIFEAIRKRHVYGTTNARIRLLFTINGHLMGDVLPLTDVKVVSIDIQGENTIKAVDIFRNGTLYKRFKPYSIVFANELKVIDMGVSNWYVRVIQMDNHMAYSSPIWFE